MTMGRQEVTTVKQMLVNEWPSTPPAATAPVPAVRPRSASVVAHAPVVGCPTVRSRTRLAPIGAAVGTVPTFPRAHQAQVQAELARGMALVTDNYLTTGIQEGGDARGVPPRGRPV
jgi:hypothetical protein